MADLNGISDASSVSPNLYEGHTSRSKLLSNSTKIRLAELAHLLQLLDASSTPLSSEDQTTSSHLGIDCETFSDILDNLFDTYAIYVDVHSRHAAESCIAAAFRLHGYEDRLGHFISRFLQVAASKTLAASSALVLVRWSSLLLQAFPRHLNLWHHSGLETIHTLARLIDLCYTYSSRPGTKQTILRVTRRGFRVLFKSDMGPDALVQCVLDLTAKASSPTPEYAHVLGVIAGVSNLLPFARAIMLAHKSHYNAYIVREYYGARRALPHNTTSSLGDYMLNFVDLDDLQRDLLPAIEKALLRAPEVIFSDMLATMFGQLPPSLDLSPLFTDKLARLLITNAKSTNSIIKAGAIDAFTCIAGRCRDQRSLTVVADELLKPLVQGKLTNVDQRAAVAQLLATLQLDQDHALPVLLQLSTFVAAESNENAANMELAALTHHLTRAFEHQIDLPDALVANVVKGMSDKRLPFRKLWILHMSQMCWSMTEKLLYQPHVSKLVSAIADRSLSSFKEAHTGPITAQTDQFATICAATSVCLARLSALQLTTEQRANLSAMIDQSLQVDPKPATLLNPKIYTKSTDSRDLTWHLRALSSLSAHVLSSTDSRLQKAWSHAIIYLIVSKDVPYTIRQAAQRDLASLYLESPRQISSVITSGIVSWRFDQLSASKDSTASVTPNGHEKLFLVIRCLCHGRTPHAQSLPQKVLDDQLLDLLTLCRPQLCPQSNWIESCLKTGTDPGDLVRRNPDACMQKIIDPTQDLNLSPFSAFRDAAYDAAADLVFVAPDVMLVKVVSHITCDLDAHAVGNVGAHEAAIYRTPEGTAFVDVLTTQAQSQAPSKNSKDYDTLKWESDLRAQLADKKGQTKKLTSEETAKVNAQLAREATTRDAVRATVKGVHRAIDMINALLRGPPTETEAWFGPCNQALFDVIMADTGRIIGENAVQAYLASADKTAPRLGPLRPFIGVAALRSAGVPDLPKSLTQEPLEDLTTRLLYRLRLMGEQRTFDPVTLSYVLPLIFTIINSDSTVKVEDDGDERIVLAGEFLSFHTSVCADTRLPRERVLVCLVSAMQRHSRHFRMFRDCLNDLCRSIAVNATEAEINVLVRNSTSPDPAVRTAVLQAISAELELPSTTFHSQIWTACHDDLEENKELANEIWQENDLSASSDHFVILLPQLSSTDKQLRRATARSLAAIVSAHQDSFSTLLELLEKLYLEKAKARTVEKDKYGMPLKVQVQEPWPARHGIALTFGFLAAHFHVDTIVPFVSFLVEQGPLGDSHNMVQQAMLEAATSVVDQAASGRVEELMNLFETTLSQSQSASVEEDTLNEAVIILYGALARHLDAGDQRVQTVVQRLLRTLSTPSESVQYAVAMCLPPLVRASPDDATSYIDSMMEQLTAGTTFAARRGAAYGLAGTVKGRGLLVLRESRIMTTLAEASANKKEPNQRQGTFLAYELFSLVLGRMFEPYVLQIVPQFLVGFGDTSAEVRQACLDAAKTCFASLSSYGVQQVLPVLLSGLDDDQWRSKKGACDSLGAMAYLDPQQLAISLPAIIPPLSEVLNDSHKEVRSSANRSLQRFGDVISNPEIKSQVSILLKALSDPTKFTDDALNALIKVNFVHYLDAPSLALVVRILERGLGDRSATKRKASQIIGSLAHLTDRKDLIAHLPILIAGLRVAVVDPVPATRATASKALGSAVEKLGEDALPDLIPSLMSTLKTDTGAGDRLGSAQALSEVLAGLGTGRLEETLPTILQNISSSKAAVREGFMSLFIYLPATFGNSFAQYLSSIIPSILTGLADDIESIRETALRAGRLLVKNFATRSIDLLLPELERGLADDNYRIRLSSVELVGDLLFNLTGITGDPDQVEADDVAHGGQSLLEVLGEEKRNKVLSALYICRCDTSGLVKAAAVDVWKALVSSPKSLKELVPTLTQALIQRLASTNPEHKLIAGNALGELIRKAGENVMATLLPTLEDGLRTSTDTFARQGICIALRELMTSASPEGLEEHEKTLMSVVTTALVDSDADVRETAASAFDAMQRVFGKKAVDQVMPYLLSLLRSEDQAEHALSALLTLLTEQARANIIIPNLLPNLLTTPITAFNARALASLSGVAKATMARRLPTILNALMDAAVTTKEENLKTELDDSFGSILLTVDEYDGLNTAMSVVLALAKHDDHRKRAATGTSLAAFFSQADIDFSRYNPDLIRVLLIAFDDRDHDVVVGAWKAMTALMGHLRKEEMEGLVTSTKQTLGHVGVPGHDLPGFSLPKGLGAVLPIFLQGLMNGSTELRTQSAMALSDIISKTSVEGLKPYVTQITGPLIRVLSERSTDVKAAILSTLNNLLEKVPIMLKPFLPQLQRTFAKSLADPTSEVLRMRAAKALGTLITMTPRVDPLITELVAGCKTPDAGVQEAMMKALFEVVSKAGSAMNEASRSSILGLIDSDSSDGDERMAVTNARLLGVLVKVLPVDASSSLIKNRVLTAHLSHSSVLALNATLRESPKSLTVNFEDSLVTTICKGISLNQSMVSEASVLAAGKYLLQFPKSAEASLNQMQHLSTLLTRLATTIDARSGSSIDCRRLSLVVIRTVCRHQADDYDTTIRPLLYTLVPPVFACVRDPIIPIKLAAEQAFLSLFRVVDRESEEFDAYITAGTANASGASGIDANAKRQMSDYFRRVALRLGAQVRERNEAEGGAGALGLSSDEVDDEREISSVGRVESE